MKAHETTIKLYSSRGECMDTVTFPSKRRAIEFVRFMLNDKCYEWTYKIIEAKK